MATRLVIEREKERKNFVPELEFKVTAQFTLNNQTWKANLNQTLNSKEQVDELFQKLKGSKFKVTNIVQSEEERNAPHPFKTSTLQQVSKFCFFSFLEYA